MTLEHRPRSGDLVRARRRHHVPAGPAALRLHPDHGLEHGRAAPGRLPVGHGGQGPRCPDRPRRPAVHPHQRDGRTSTSRCARGTDIVFLGALINHVLSTGREFREYVRHYTNARVIVGEDFRDTEDLDGLFSGWDAEAGRYDPSSWSYAGHAARRGGRDRRTPAHGAHGAGMHLPGGRPPEEDWSLEHERCVFQILRRHFARYTPEEVQRICGVPGRAVPRGRRGAVRQLGPRAHVGHLLRRRLDPAHDRRAGHPRRVDPAAAAGQHRPPRRRHPGAARPREHPGLDRHPDALRHPAGLHPDAQARARDVRRLGRRQRAADRRLGRGAQLPGLAAAGVVRRRRDRRERLGLRPAAARRRRPLALHDVPADDRPRDARLPRHRPEPGRRLGQLGAAAQGARGARLARRPRHQRDRDGRVLARLARDRERRRHARADRHRGLPAARRDPRREGRHVHQHPAAAAVAREGRRAAGRLPLGVVVRPPAVPAGPRAARRLRASRATGRCTR